MRKIIAMVIGTLMLGMTSTYSSVTANGSWLLLGNSMIAVASYDPHGPSTLPNDITPTTVPGTLLLLGSVLSCLAFWGKRRKVTKA